MDRDFNYYKTNDDQHVVIVYKIWYIMFAIYIEFAEAIVWAMLK